MTVAHFDSTDRVVDDHPLEAVKRLRAQAAAVSLTRYVQCFAEARDDYEAAAEIAKARGWSETEELLRASIGVRHWDKYIRARLRYRAMNAKVSVALT